MFAICWAERNKRTIIARKQARPEGTIGLASFRTNSSLESYNRLQVNFNFEFGRLGAVK